MKRFELEVGHSYLTRDSSEKIKIVRLAQKTDLNYSKAHPFVDEDGYIYMKNGRVDNKKEYPFDLVSPYNKETKHLLKKPSPT